MARKKTAETPEEGRRQLENQRRLEELIERRLAQEGVTREEALRRLHSLRP
jgi:hypothetical protein